MGGHFPPKKERRLFALASVSFLLLWGILICLLGLIFMAWLGVGLLKCLVGLIFIIHAWLAVQPAYMLGRPHIHAWIGVVLLICLVGLIFKPGFVWACAYAW